MEDLDGQVIGKVEIGQRSPHPAPAQLPLFGAFCQESVVDPLTLLGKNGFLFDLRIELLRRDDPTAEKLVAHPAADVDANIGYWAISR